MNLNLKDKVYIVSGGSEGIGAAITKTLIEEEAKVLILTKAEQATFELAEHQYVQHLLVQTAPLS